MNKSSRAATLGRLERAFGFPLGAQPGAPALGHSTQPVRSALERVMLSALHRTPCAVAFSGGRDSSAVLALATSVARRHGLESPIPVTLSFPRAPTTHESQWQELVIAQLGLRDWERIEMGSELDFLGELARTGLRRHGLLWAPNAHFLVPLFARASGGSLLTGVDGDGLFGWAWAELRARLVRRGPVNPRDVLRVALATSPAAIRAGYYRRRLGAQWPWLRPAARQAVWACRAAERASEPVRFDRRLDWYARRRLLHVMTHNFSVLAAAQDTHVVHPLLDRGFLAAFATRGGRGGYGDRTAAMRWVFGDLLPEAVLTRRSKAEFGAAFWGPASRAFAATWDGSGLDEELVDTDALRAVWRDENPPPATATLMQQAWLAANERERDGARP